MILVTSKGSGPRHFSKTLESIEAQLDEGVQPYILACC